MKNLKHVIALLLAVFCTISMSACSSKTVPAAEIAPGVEFEMLDVLQINNDITNTSYYYFLASLNNNSDQAFHVADLSYTLASKDKDEITPISSMDNNQSTISMDLGPGMKTSVYGYYGFPRSNYKSIGLRFGQDQFISFNSVKIRTLQEDNIVNSDNSKFVLYEDNVFDFEVDTSNLKYNYKNGVSVITGLVLTYKNKTDSRVVVPYMTPVCTIDGLELGNYPNPNKLKNMSLEELKKQDFKTNGMAPKTRTYTGTALNYQLYYLDAYQEVPCQVTFTFKGIIPDFSASTTNSGITVNISSAPLGYSQLVKVPY